MTRGRNFVILLLKGRARERRNQEKEGREGRSWEDRETKGGGNCASWVGREPVDSSHFLAAVRVLTPSSLLIPRTFSVACEDWGWGGHGRG